MRSWPRSGLASSPRVMAEQVLRDELAELVGSSREASWILAQVEEPDAAREMARRRAAGEPLQYLLGFWPFREIELLVDPRALIPRPETEHVVEQALAAWRQTRPGADCLVLVDLGTGSGAIGLSLCVELAGEVPIAHALLTDRSATALELAAENAQRLGLDVELYRGSWHQAIPSDHRGGVHLLVANPPYVDAAEEGDLAIEMRHEPRSALIAPAADDDTPGFADVAAVIDGAPDSLAPRGIVVIEMAEHQVPVARRRAESVGLVEVRDFTDLAGHPRGIVGSAP